MKSRKERLFRFMGIFRMKGLFFKVFLWFWLTLVLIFASTTAWTLLAESGPWFSLWRNAMEEGLRASGRGAVLTGKFQRNAEMVEYLKALGSKSQVRFRLYDEKGEALTNAPPSPRFDALVMQALKSDRLTFTVGSGTFLAALQFEDPQGNRFVIVRRSHKGVMEMLLSREFLPLLLKLFLISIILAFVSFLLARTITKPILTLKEAVHRFAKGDMTVRVQEKLGSRKDEIATLGRGFDDMAERIQSLLNTQERLLRDISHELRSPLTRLFIALDLLRRDPSLGKMKYFKQIEKESHRMSQLIDQLLSVVRIQDGKKINNTSVVDLTILVRKATENVALEAEVKPCTIESRLEEGVLAPGMSELLYSAVENLIRNAVYHTTPGTVIRVRLYRERKNAFSDFGIIEVYDQGPGVPEESLHDIFLPFFRLDSAREAASGKVGLGLAIAKSAVEKHKGSLTAFNHPQAGLMMRMSLPL